MSLPFFGLVMIIFNIAAFGWNEFYPAKIGHHEMARMNTNKFMLNEL